MVQKSSVKKDALLPWNQRGRVGGCVSVFTLSLQSPALLLQIPEGRRRQKGYTLMDVLDWNKVASKSEPQLALGMV